MLKTSSNGIKRYRSHLEAMLPQYNFQVKVKLKNLIYVLIPTVMQRNESTDYLTDNNETTIYENLDIVVNHIPTVMQRNESTDYLTDNNETTIYENLDIVVNHIPILMQRNESTIDYLSENNETTIDENLDIVVNHVSRNTHQSGLTLNNHEDVGQEVRNECEEVFNSIKKTFIQNKKKALVALVFIVLIFIIACVTGTLNNCHGKNVDSCKVDGGFSQWSAYSTCSVTCGNGLQKRERTCTNPVPSGGGKDCVGNLSETIKCNLDKCIGLTLGFSLQWNLLKRVACFQPKGDFPAQIQINQYGVLIGIKMMHLYGGTKCYNSSMGSRFGCFNDQSYFNLVVTDNNKVILFPSPNQEVTYIDGSKNYQYPGFLPTDKEVVFINFEYPTYFKVGDYISIWNFEDFNNFNEEDNSGEVCVNVYGAFN
ncbi:uncharacterized protein LOC105843886 isoform X2 [Hydra vulgaris]|uniref:uncharacterized protein LOC105843886 isoform X2 n=1 Tax=Hydra vulgaris TaxID=6087 RepID=UPI0032EA4339